MKTQKVILTILVIALVILLIHFLRTKTEEFVSTKRLEYLTSKLDSPNNYGKGLSCRKKRDRFRFKNTKVVLQKQNGRAVVLDSLNPNFYTTNYKDFTKKLTRSNLFSSFEMCNNYRKGQVEGNVNSKLQRILGNIYPRRNCWDLSRENKFADVYTIPDKKILKREASELIPPETLNDEDIIDTCYIPEEEASCLDFMDDPQIIIDKDRLYDKEEIPLEDLSKIKPGDRENIYDVCWKPLKI